MFNEVELYARGLALADGTWPRGKKSLIYCMKGAASVVLKQIGDDQGSKNGVRFTKRGLVG